MPQAILPRITNNCQDDKKSEVFIEEYQVDSISTSSQEIKEAEEEFEYFNTDNAIVVNDKPHLPHFGSVSVVNSNDVHFGNRTVYKGPVTIKQFVYPNGDVKSDGENSLNNLVRNIDPTYSGGVVNKGYEKNHIDSECGVVLKEEKSEGREQETNTIGRRIRKGFKWVKGLPRKQPKETILFLFVVVVSITTISSVIIWRNPYKVVQVDDNGKRTEEDDIVPIDYSQASDVPFGKLRIVNRLTWLAQPPSGTMDVLKLPVSLVIISHTATVECFSQAQCIFQTRHIQTFHMESNGWSDIGYNFLVGGDGAVYEGRNWKTEGAHTLGWNNVSIGVSFIGTFNDKTPPDNMLSAFGKLMERGVELGNLREDYKVMAARQFSGTESPGKVFYETIKSWTRWSDLKHLMISFKS